MLVNLGTPDDTSVPAVRRYLREFLSDPRVIDLNPVGRWMLLNLIILPFRPAKSAEAYRKIWTEDGSPLLVHGEALVREVQARLGDGWKVVLAMRYGRPSLQDALHQLAEAGVHRVTAMPLYPQYASSTTGSTLERLYELAGEGEVVPSLTAVPPFHDAEAYLDAAAAITRDGLAGFDADHVLFSFHGLPERQVRKADPSGAHCLASASCCEVEVPANRTCYRRQCFATARGLASRLGLADGAWSVSFQSRLGRTPWIRPYTDEVLRELAGRGVRRLAVATPAFVADCLETLEELGIRGKATFESAGGEAFRLVPSLNADPRWADAVAALVRDVTGTATGAT